jgi:putative membrane protein
MLVTNKPSPRRVIRHFGVSVSALLVWDLLIAAAFQSWGWRWVASEHIPLALYGSVIGIVVAFRNNAAYSRWWEARTILGQITNSSRTLARQVCGSFCVSPDATTLCQAIVYHQIAFVHALCQQLRGLDPIGEIGRLLSPAQLSPLRVERNVPLALQRNIGSMLRLARQRDWIDSREWQSIDRTLSELTAAQGGAERIKTTPMPKQYDFFVMAFVHAYCLLLPVGLVSRLGWFTPLGSTFIGFMFLAMDRIGRSLEVPFDNDVYDVPLTAIATTVEINLREMLEESQVPEAASPVGGVLW